MPSAGNTGHREAQAEVGAIAQCQYGGQAYRAVLDED